MLSNSELWWSSIPGAAQLVEDMASKLMRMESTILYVEEAFPWPDVFRMNVKDQVLHYHPEYTWEVCDAASLGTVEPGRWILEHVGGSRIFCLPSDDPVQLALQQGLMQDRIFWVTNCSTKEQVIAWTTIAKQMKKAKSHLGGCIALILDKRLRVNSAMKVLDSTDCFGEYDFNFFANSLISHTRLKQFEKKYLSELAVQLAFGSAERCAELVGMGRALFQNPEEPIRWAKSSKCAHAIWQAQMRTVFSSIEEKKFDLIQQNKEAVQPLLGTVDDYGNPIEQIEDIELRHLIHADKHKIVSLPEQATKKLNVLHASRNQLAHHKVLPYEELEQLEKVL